MLANTIELLSEYSKDISELNLSNKNIDGLLDLFNFNSLIKLDCSSTKIKSLNNLPNSLIELYCSYTNITSLDLLPTSLIKLDCSHNTEITSLNLLPNSLIKLDCSHNTEITSLNNLPNSLIKLDCYYTKIINIECIKKSNPKLKIIN